MSWPHVSQAVGYTPSLISVGIPSRALELRFGGVSGQPIHPWLFVESTRLPQKRAVKLHLIIAVQRGSVFSFMALVLLWIISLAINHVLKTP